MIELFIRKTFSGEIVEKSQGAIQLDEFDALNKLRHISFVIISTDVIDFDYDKLANTTLVIKNEKDEELYVCGLRPDFDLRVKPGTLMLGQVFDILSEIEEIEEIEKREAKKSEPSLTCRSRSGAANSSSQLFLPDSLDADSNPSKSIGYGILVLSVVSGCAYAAYKYVNWPSVISSLKEFYASAVKAILNHPLVSLVVAGVILLLAAAAFSQKLGSFSLRGLSFLSQPTDIDSNLDDNLGQAVKNSKRVRFAEAVEVRGLTQNHALVVTTVQ